MTVPTFDTSFIMSNPPVAPLKAFEIDVHIPSKSPETAPDMSPFLIALAKSSMLVAIPTNISEIVCASATSGDVSVFSSFEKNISATILPTRPPISATLSIPAASCLSRLIMLPEVPNPRRKPSMNADTKPVNSLNGVMTFSMLSARSVMICSVDFCFLLAASAPAEISS